jgi:hypothetical protein
MVPFHARPTELGIINNLITIFLIFIDI